MARRGDEGGRKKHGETLPTGFGNAGKYIFVVLFLQLEGICMEALCKCEVPFYCF